jgi:hypothetical protein
MGNIESDRATKIINTVSGDFKRWQVQKDTDSRMVHSRLKYEFDLASYQLKDLIENIEPSIIPYFIAGTEPVEGIVLDKLPYDFYQDSPRTLLPNGFLTLELATNFTDRQNGPELYFGGIEIYIAASGLAKALTEGGSLGVIGVPEAEERTNV